MNKELSNNSAIWGNHSVDLKQIISAIYEEVITWKINLFLLPSGKGDKGYTSEYTRVIHTWVNNNPLQQAAVKFIMIMPSLLLQ